MAEQRRKIRLGDLLVTQGLITEAQLDEALAEQRRSGRKLGATLIELGMVTEDAMLGALAQQLDIPFVDLARYELSPEIVGKLSEVHARRFRALVLRDQGEAYLVGMADPTDIYAIDELQNLLARPLQLAVVREGQLLEAIDNLYRRTQEIEELAERVDTELGEAGEFRLGELEAQEAGDAPVARLLRTIFEDAVKIEASDVHIEPDHDVVRIRQRVDGMLQEHVMDERRIAAALVLRLKLMAGLDISEKRLPQDGRFSIQVSGHSLDVRTSTMPTQHGETVVLRLLDQSQGLASMSELGMPEAVRQRFQRMIQRPHGLVLVTGPTGSGKTTTLYVALSELNRAAKKIITVEDPVEYRLPRVNQVQVSPRIQLTFPSVLRSALRQDPDIIFIGEMRDAETAQIGLRAAMTGHLVLSTLHTNDAVSSALRLIDMGAEPYLVASSLRGVLAQRLVRRICDHCRETYAIGARERAWLSRLLGEDELQQQRFERGTGCHHCGYTGYRGRIGVFEMLEIREAMVDALRRNDTRAFEVAAESQESYQALAGCAFEYARSGVTTLEEVFRVTELPEEMV